jgi:SAM-dependent methyltransferase
MYSVSSCPSCEERERTLVAEFNRLIAADSTCQSPLARSDYMLCHGCGLVYASLRPERHEYEYLYSNFNELLFRPTAASQNIFTVSDPLTPELTQEIDSVSVPWWELRSASAEGNRVIGPMLYDFQDALGDLPDLMLHTTLSGAKVLQLRAKTAIFADFLRRVFGVQQVDLVTIFPIHQYVAEKLGFRASATLDYERFNIPFPEKYDIIIENHLFTHMLDPAETFATLRDHLAEGGHLWIRKEADDERLFRKRANLFSELRPFHFQQFDIPSLRRMLGRFGFSVKVLRHKQAKKSELIGLACLEGSDVDETHRIGDADLAARRNMYLRWRDESIFSLPSERADALFGAEARAARARVEAAGGLETDKKGRPRAARRIALEDLVAA